MGKPIFISYRTRDAAGHADHLFYALTQCFPQQIFFDVETLEPGALWSQEIEDNVRECQVLLVVIGQDWLKCQDPKSGQRCLDRREDWVRGEIEIALSRNPQPLIIPLLVADAGMPEAEYLPESIKALPGLQYKAIHRDKRSIEELVEQLRKILRHTRPPSSVDITTYLEKLRRETEFIDIKGIQTGQREAPRFEISRLYTPLTTVLQAEENREPLPLQQALQNRRVVLVGDPGAGKSTFLRRMAFACCTGDSNFMGVSPPPFPILIEAGGLSNFIDAARPRQSHHPADDDSPEWIMHYLQRRSREMNWGLPIQQGIEFFEEKFSDGCLLLVDGLDEAPDRARRKRLASLLVKAANAHEGLRIVVASRPSAYGGETRLTDYQTLEIGKLSREAIATFIGNWYGALYPKDPDTAEERGQSLNEAIYGRAEIEEMALNPFMLTALAVLHWSEAKLPDQRAELYHEILKWLARTKHEKPNPHSPARASADECLDLMQHLAFSMHKEGLIREITPYAAANALKDRFRSVPEEERLTAAEKFLENEEVDSGILVGRDGKLRFWHRTFQEYLAAKALAGRDGEREKLLFGESRLYARDWRETILLLGGLLREQDTARIDGFLKQMLDGAESSALPERARCVGLIGSILRDLKAWKYEIADPRYMQYLLSTLGLFEDPKTARSVEFATRLDVADALGQAGDPRLAEDKKWVRVEGGKFWMGAQKDGAHNADPDARDNEGPVREVEVAPFWLGRYPVTVAEYAECVVRGHGSEPDEWQRQLRYPSRPVVNVDWQQASDYCRWAEGRLPTDAEWECAARSGREGFRYPWGPEPPDEYKANYRDKGPRHVTPVGMYPEGATPSKLFDLAGNVWEWVDAWYDEAKEYRGLRGGSWYNVSAVLRAAVRSGYRPDYRLGGIGFRCVRDVFP